VSPTSDDLPEALTSGAPGGVVGGRRNAARGEAAEAHSGSGRSQGREGTCARGRPSIQEGREVSDPYERLAINLAESNPYVDGECLFCGKCHVAPPEVTCDCTSTPSGSPGGIDAIISAPSPPSTHTSDGSPESTESPAENER
jgi:hypothetical protein